jgi:glycosyltransferase involved in cell wall biosynthesis
VVEIFTLTDIEELMGQRLSGQLKISVIIQNLDWNLTYQEGASTQLYHILSGLQAVGHKLTLMASRPDKTVLFSPDCREGEIASLNFTTKRTFQSVESVARRLQTTLKLPWVQIFDSLRLYDAGKQHVSDFDLLYERNSMHGIGGALLSRQLKLPYVLHVDADFLYEHDFLGIPHTKLERLIAEQTARYNYQMAHAISCVSEVTKRHLISHYQIPAEKICVIPNGTIVPELPDPVAVQETRQRLNLDNQSVIMFVGSFYPWHGLPMLVDAFKLVAQKAPEARLVLVGDGETRELVQAEVRRLGLADRVHFTGSVAHEQVPILLGVADVAVAPYPRMDVEFWGSPMKVFEYMGAGKAIVASCAGQIGVVINHGKTGLLVEPGDVTGMAGAILNLLEQPRLRAELGSAARETVKCKHTWKRYTEDLESVFDYAMARARIVR